MSSEKKISWLKLLKNCPIPYIIKILSVHLFEETWAAILYIQSVIIGYIRWILEWGILSCW